MRVRFTTGLNEELTVADIPTLPRVGEVVRLNNRYIALNNGDESDTAWQVHQVSYELAPAEEWMATIVVERWAPTEYHILVEWVPPTDQPEWVGDEPILPCDIVPRVGELIALNRYWFNADRSISENIHTVEVISVVYTSVSDRSNYDGDKIHVFGDTSICVIVRNVPSDLTMRISRRSQQLRN